MEIILKSTITCSHCGHKKEEIMPIDGCRFFYESEQCNTILKLKAADCCVFCSYADFPFPSVQAKNNCCNN
jgi:hypothetical protein